MDLSSKVQAFIEEYTGKMIAFQNNAVVPAGSCMNVPHQFIYEMLGLTDPDIIYGAYAYEVYTNFASLPAAKYFTLVANTSTNVPVVGDIPVFGQTENTPEGHICLFVSGDVNSLTCFEENYPTGSTAHLQTHSYDGLLGWLHFNPPGQSPTQNATATDQQITDQLSAQIQATNSCQAQLKEATAQAATLQTELTQETEQVQSLKEQLKDAQSQITTLQTQLGDEQKEIVNLNTQIEIQASSNKDYATEIYALTHENSDLTSSFNSIVDGLGVSRTSKTLEQITKAALSKEDDLDILLKAAGVVEGLLHNVAATLQLDDPNATDQQVANNIISYVKSLQGKLQSIMPKGQAVGTTMLPQSSLWGKFIGWFWQKKGGL